MSWVVKDFSELTAREIYEILKSRAEVFQKEQGIHYVDPDDVDYESLHVFRIENGRVDAYLRAYRGGEDSVKIGRVLTLNHGQGIGTELMRFAIREIPKRMECKWIIMDAQKDAFDDELWGCMVEKVTVQTDGTMLFAFKSGYEVTV